MFFCASLNCMAACQLKMGALVYQGSRMPAAPEKEKCACGSGLSYRQCCRYVEKIGVDRIGGQGSGDKSAYHWVGAADVQGRYNSPVIKVGSLPMLRVTIE